MTYSVAYPESPTISTHRGRTYRPDIDGIRAIAIFSVVAFHTKVPLFKGGFVGVDVFFVISGYLISSLVYRDIVESKFSLIHFYERRVKRILPAMLTVLVVCSVLAFVLLSPLELTKYCEEAFAAVVSASNIYYWRQPSYFNTSSIFKPLLMTWSLGVEEQFYLLFPVGLFLLYKFARRYLFHCIVVVCGLSLIASAICVNIYPSAAFYLLPMRAWELGIGVLIAIQETRRIEDSKASSLVVNVMGWLGLALIIFPVLFYTEGTPFPGLAALLPTVGTACLIKARESFINRRVFAFGPMVFVGLVSYSWYLWHWPLLSFARIVSGGLLSVEGAVLISFLSLILSVFSYRFVEQPFRKSATPARHLLPRYAVAMLLVAIITFVGYRARGWPARRPQLAKMESFVHGLSKSACLATLDDSNPLLKAPCTVNGTAQGLAVWGDSHAAALGATLREAAIQHGYNFEFLTKASCPPLSEVSLRLAARPTFERTCESFNRTVLQHLLENKNVNVVVLAGFWSGPWYETERRDFYTESSQSGKEVSPEESYQNLHDGLLKTIKSLKASGKRVFVVTDVPRFDPDPMTNVRNSIMKERGELAKFISSNTASLDPVAEEAVRKPADIVTDREVRQAAAEGGAEIIDLSRNLCTASHCRFWDDGTLLYSDSNHLTPAGAEYALRGQYPISN